MIFRRTVVLLACVLTAGLATSSSAGAFQIGMQDDAAFVSAPPFARDVALDQAHAMGVTYLRVSLVWEAFHDDGWRPYDAVVNAARARGMSVQLTVTGNPKFTGHGQGYIRYWNPSPGRYATWLGAVARHFRGRVKYYSVWNEPNLHDYLAPQVVGHHAVGHEIYAHLVNAGYRAVHRADPGAKVLIGEMAPSGHPLRFLERAGRSVPGGLRADGWAHHPYQFVRVAPGRRTSRYMSISNIATMKARLRTLARRHLVRTGAGHALPIYFTEFGYPRPGSYYGFFSEGARATYSLKAFQFAKRMGVRVLVWYQLYQHPGPPNSHLWDTGLITARGKPTLAYRRLVAARVSLAGF